MKVFIVSAWDYGDSGIAGVYFTKEKAEARIIELKKNHEAYKNDASQFINIDYPEFANLECSGIQEYEIE